LTAQWPVTLRRGEVTLRPLESGDAKAWREVRVRNAAWLKPWDATVPPGSHGRPASFRVLVRRLSRLARDDAAMPFAVVVDGAFVGQVTVNNIVRGSAQFASIGYWIDQSYAGRGIIPRAVAMAIDHCFGPVGLHRIEVAIRPENVSSLRVVEKLGINEIGFAPRFLHIDGEWRDHRIFAITREEVPLGLQKRLSEADSPKGVPPGSTTY
jgi:ribosomal-protein-alanine N-acetyltransferase